MKHVLNSIFVLCFCMSFVSMQAQTIVQPSEPNEICAQAWKDYQSANKLWKAGWGLFVPGVVGTAVCTTLGVITSFKPGPEPNPDLGKPYKPKYDYLVCWSFLGLSSGALVASIPCLVIGQSRRKAAMKTINSLNCPPDLTYDEIKICHKRAEDTWKAGWGLFGGGFGLIALGIPLTFPLKQYNFPVELAGYCMIGVGCGAVIASFPCLAFGQAERKAYLNLQTSSNGLGLALNF